MVIRTNFGDDGAPRRKRVRNAAWLHRLSCPRRGRPSRRVRAPPRGSRRLSVRARVRSPTRHWPPVGPPARKHRPATRKNGGRRRRPVARNKQPAPTSPPSPAPRYCVRHWLIVYLLYALKLGLLQFNLCQYFPFVSYFVCPT